MRGLHDRSWPWQQNPPSGGRTPIVIRFKHQPPKRPATSTVREILHAHRFIGDSEPTLILVGQSSPFCDSVNGSVFIWEPTFDQRLTQLKTSIGVGANEAMQSWGQYRRPPQHDTVPWHDRVIRVRYAEVRRW